MYCIVQEIQNKKPNRYGAHKEIEVYTWTFNGEVIYAYRWSDDRFERPIKTAYKITLRESHRVNGKVKAKQWSLGTIGYYYMAEYGFYEDVEGKVQAISEETGIPWDKLYEIVEAKLEPLYERIRAEYTQTEEYKVSQKHSEITRKYAAARTEFENTYGSNTYDRCYDVFGTLRNAEYLEILKKNHSYYEQFKSDYNSYSYQDYFKGNYSDSYQGNNNSKHIDEKEKARLRKVYKKLCIKLHPDNGGAKKR